MAYVQVEADDVPIGRGSGGPPVQMQLFSVRITRQAETETQAPVIQTEDIYKSNQIKASGCLAITSRTLISILRQYSNGVTRHSYHKPPAHTFLNTSILQTFMGHFGP
ncbi:hypothetical protein AX15_000220 [Amanita polypyramis BW_CC]|nr:hypothetical protein AX15_000220 [Amanita polypyramis BW_CC]